MLKPLMKKQVKVEMTEFDTIFIKINGCKTKQTTYPANGGRRHQDFLIACVIVRIQLPLLLPPMLPVIKV